MGDDLLQPVIFSFFMSDLISPQLFRPHMFFVVSHDLMSTVSFSPTHGLHPSFQNFLKYSWAFPTQKVLGNLPFCVLTG